MSAGIGTAIGNIFGAVGSYLSNFNTSYNNVQSVLQTNRSNRELAELQNKANIDLWREQRDYNDPLNQVQRLRKAGINPGIMYGSGVPANTADAPPTMQASRDVAPQSTFNMDPLTAAQIANIDADTESKRLQNEYQDYMNEVERQLSRIPLGEVRTVSEDGKETVEVIYGNARVRMARSEMRMLGFSENGLQFQLADLMYDLALKVGDNSFTDLSTFNPTQSPNYDEDSSALRGDRNVRIVAGRLATIGENAAKAEKAGREAYAKWLDDHKDDPFVKFALTLQGFFQTMGISLPSIGVNSSTDSKGHTARSWYFGKK